MNTQDLYNQLDELHEKEFHLSHDIVDYILLLERAGVITDETLIKLTKHLQEIYIKQGELFETIDLLENKNTVKH